MRRQGRLCAGTLLAFTLCCAAGFAAPEKAAAHPYLWKIEGADRKPSWIFGTIHLQRPDVAELPPVVLDALKQAGAVNTEIPADLESMLAVAPKMMIPGGGTVDKMLGPALTADVEKEIKTINPQLTIDPLLHLKPWALAAMLIELEDQAKFPGSLALDMVIYQRAAMAGKEVGGLETPDEQLAVFDAFSPAEQVMMVQDTIRQLRLLRAGGRSPSDFFAGLYLAGDLDKLVNELNKLDSSGEDPKLTEKFMNLLLYARNARMAERIVKKLRENPDKSWFFAVGAAHLQGPRGLLAALEKAGFRLSRVQ